MADPRGGAVFETYWTRWNAFELDHDSEDTFRVMLRLKRSVQIQNVCVHLGTSAVSGAVTVEAAASVESDRQAAKARKEKSVQDKSRGDVAGGATAIWRKMY